MLHHDATSVVVYNVYGTEVYLGHTGIVIRPGGIVIHPGGLWFLSSVCPKYTSVLWRVECIFKVFSIKIGNVSQSQMHKFFSTFFQWPTLTAIIYDGNSGVRMQHFFPGKTNNMLGLWEQQIRLVTRSGAVPVYSAHTWTAMMFVVWPCALWSCSHRFPFFFYRRPLHAGTPQIFHRTPYSKSWMEKNAKIEGIKVKSGLTPVLRL